MRPIAPADSTAPGWIARQDAAVCIIVTCDPWQNQSGYGIFCIRGPREDNDHEIRKWSQTDADDADDDCPWAPAWGMRKLETAREKQQGSSEDYATGESNRQPGSTQVQVPFSCTPYWTRKITIKILRSTTFTSLQDSGTGMNLLITLCATGRDSQTAKFGGELQRFPDLSRFCSQKSDFLGLDLDFESNRHCFLTTYPGIFIYLSFS
jgi:hypothetical protein